MISNTVVVCYYGFNIFTSKHYYVDVFYDEYKNFMEMQQFVYAIIASLYEVKEQKLLTACDWSTWTHNKCDLKWLHTYATRLHYLD